VNARRTCVPGEAAQLPALTQFLQAFWSAEGLSPAQAMAFELALEEAFMNIVTHGAPQGRPPPVEVSLSLEAGWVTMTVEDEGAPFDPLSLPPPDLEAGLEQRAVGGLGVYLVRKVMDAVSYDRAGTRNRLSMSKHVAG
jgi:serine/threonine-protein kinase RsbW